MTLTNVDIQLYVVYLMEDETPIYYKGSTFYNVSEWTTEITCAFFFNHEPRRFELTEILENSDYKDIGMSDILIKSLQLEVKKTNEV